MTEAEQRNLEHARRYLAALEGGATGDALAGFFTADVVQEEFPNRLIPSGARRDLAALLDGAVRGQKVMQAQRFEVLNALASGDQVAVELQWIGTVAVPLGSLPVGGQMRARFAIFLVYRDRKIARQHNYDCFDPW
jgi:ketosteroid isomerase-like protein